MERRISVNGNNAWECFKTGTCKPLDCTVVRCEIGNELRSLTPAPGEEICIWIANGVSTQPINKCKTARCKTGDRVMQIRTALQAFIANSNGNHK